MSDGMQLPIKPITSGKCTSGFCTPLADQRPQVMLVPPKRALPIIFIPGIMGSNLRISTQRQKILRKENNIAWRADSTSETSHFLKINSANRQRQLDPSETSVDTYDGGKGETGNSQESALQRNSGVDLNSIYQWHISRNQCVLLTSDAVGTKHSKTDLEKALERGWGEVLFDSYGELLQLLEMHLNNPFYENHEPSEWWKNSVLNIKPASWGAIPYMPQEPIKQQDLKKALDGCWFPIHAMGYNWLQSNRESGSVIARRVRDLIKQYTSNGFECKKVILVSHSMGGLVVRAATHPAIGNIEDLVLGVVHGAMPAVGAGITYKRLRCGFEGGIFNLTRKVLGKSGKEVTAVLGNAQGGLELLPTKSYGNSWLQAQFNDQILMKLPINGDPFEEIYKIKDRWYRLLNPNWINPASLRNSGINQSFELLDLCKKFHEKIDKYYHPNSYSIYGSDPNKLTWGDVVWRFHDDISSQKIPELVLSKDDAVGKLNFHSIDVSNSPKFNFGMIRTLHISATLSSATEPGDSTVPIRSADDQLRSSKVVFRQIGYEHQSSFNNEHAIYATFYSIIQIIKTMNWSSG